MEKIEMKRRGLLIVFIIVFLGYEGGLASARQSTEPLGPLFRDTLLICQGPIPSGAVVIARGQESEGLRTLARVVVEVGEAENVNLAAWGAVATFNCGSKGWMAIVFEENITDATSIPVCQGLPQARLPPDGFDLVGVAEPSEICGSSFAVRGGGRAGEDGEGKAVRIQRALENRLAHETARLWLVLEMERNWSRAANETLEVRNAENLELRRRLEAAERGRVDELVGTRLTFEAWEEDNSDMGRRPWYTPQLVCQGEIPPGAVVIGRGSTAAELSTLRRVVAEVAEMEGADAGDWRTAPAPGCGSRGWMSLVFLGAVGPISPWTKSVR